MNSKENIMAQKKKFYFFGKCASFILYDGWYMASHYQNEYLYIEKMIVASNNLATYAKRFWITSLYEIINFRNTLLCYSFHDKKITQYFTKKTFRFTEIRVHVPKKLTL